MIFTPYTQPVKPAEFVGTVDLNVYAKGLANKQQMYEQNLKSVTDDFSKLFSINAYGPDKERLKALENQLREEVGSINLSDLTDMGTVSKIKGLIRSYGSDPQMLAIAKRTSTYETELSNQQKAMEKGEKYTSPALDTLGKYYNQSNFYEKPKGVNLTNGWYSFNDAKALKAAKELVREREEIVEDAQGRRVIKKYYDPSDLYAALKTVQASDPSYEKDMNYQFQQQYGDIDWQDYANEQHSTIAQEAKNTMDQAQSIYNSPSSTTQEKANALKNYQDAKKYFDIYSDIYNSPESVEEVKQNTFNDFKNRRIQRMISAVDAVQNTPAAMDEIKKMQYQNAQTQQNKIFDMQLKTGITRQPGESQSSYIQRLAQGAYEKDLAIAQAKQDIKTEAQKQLQENAADLKVKYLDQQGKFKAITNKGGDIFTLGGEKFNKSTVLNSIGTDVNIVQKILESNPSKFGLDCNTCNGKIDDTHGLVDKGDHYEYQQQSWVPGGETTFTIKKDALQAYVLDSNTQIDISEGKGDVISGGEVDIEVYESPEEKKPAESEKQTGYKWSSGEAGKSTPKTYEEYKELFVKANNNIQPTAEQEKQLKAKWNAAK